MYPRWLGSPLLLILLPLFAPLSLAAQSGPTADPQADSNPAVTTPEVTAARLKQQSDTENTQAEQTFMGLKFGAGLGVTADLTSGSRVSSAKVVNGIVRVDDESNIQPRVFLEMHNFINGKNPPDPDHPKFFGTGPWIGIQSSQDKVIDSFAIGWMWGWRQDPKQTSSFNIGIGVVFDSKVQVLGDGIEKNKPLPAGETEVRFKTESRTGVALVTSFSF